MKFYCNNCGIDLKDINRVKHLAVNFDMENYYFCSNKCLGKFLDKHYLNKDIDAITLNIYDEDLYYQTFKCLTCSKELNYQDKVYDYMDVGVCCSKECLYAFLLNNGNITVTKVITGTGLCDRCFNTIHEGNHIICINNIDTTVDINVEATVCSKDCLLSYYRTQIDTTKPSSIINNDTIVIYDVLANISNRFSKK